MLITNDVTEFVERYRLALRHIWNSYFWIDPALRNWDSVYSFRTLKQPMFNALVADRIGLEQGNQIFGKGFRVVPALDYGGEFSDLQVNLSVPSSPNQGVWDLLKGPFKAEDIELTLVDLFDWAPLYCLDFRYYVVVIDSFSKNPDKVGQHALVDVMYTRVLFTRDDAEETSRPEI